MSARLASETITITLDGHPVELVPTLRAALRRARQYGDYAALIRKLSEGDTETLAAVIQEGAGMADALPVLFAEFERQGVLPVLAKLIAPASLFVVMLAGPESDDDGTSTKTGEPMTFADFHSRLFRIGTGWLGWTPAQAWAATPSEILAAHEGRTDMLKAIFGGGEDKPKTKGKLSDRLRDFFARKA